MDGHASSVGALSRPARRRSLLTFAYLRRHALGAASGALLWAFGAVGAPAPAQAQESADALASRALFDEARRLMNAEKFAEACPKLEESQRLRSGIGTQFNLAECYEKLGRFASAWSVYLRVAADTKALGQVDRERVARARAQALEPRVAYLSLQVPEPAPGIELTLDGSAMGPATWGVPTPLDPGEHVVVARAPGHEPWQGAASIPTHGARISLEVPPLKPRAATPPSRALAAPLQPAAPQSPGETEGPDLTVPYVIGGVGASLVVISGLLGLRFLNQNAEAKEVCKADADACSDADIERHEDLLGAARSARAGGFATLALGLVGLGVGGVWIWQSTPDAGAEPSDMALGAHIGPSEAVLEYSLGF
ncbi:MAG TPA: hypothetical protein VNN80_24520 [Polyangiaceae bacterium]|nr:hypothetical protein [Polyangiaceae bacterium]